MKKRILTLAVAAIVCIGTFSGCSMFQQKTSALDTYDFSNLNLVQLKEPTEGQDVAVIDTTMGKMTVVLYPEYAPNIVNNFKTRVKDGFYNGKSFFGVENGIYALTGASNDEGTEGVTDDGQLITDEYTQNLWPYKGAMMSFSSTMGYGDSRFFFCGARAISTADLDELKSYKNEDGSQKIPDNLINSFVEKGSVPGFAGVYTVYGQMINGFDTLDKILAVEVDADTKKPTTDIKINTITLSTYKKGEYEIETPKVPDLVVSETTAQTNESGEPVTQATSGSETTTAQTTIAQ